MQNDFEFVSTSDEIINDNVNVTEQKPLIEGLKIVVQLIYIIVCLYFTIYFSAGIALKSLSLKNQIKLENAISKLSNIERTHKCYKDKKTDRIKNLILSYDKNYPKTSKLEVKIIETDDLNAFCFPNGTIYITSGLYKLLKQDDELAFVLAHEMAHYKNKDHLQNLKTTAANSCVIILMSVLTNDENINNILSDAIKLTSLKYSRNAERKADKYAGNILLGLYNTTSGGVRVLNILNQKSDLPEAVSFFSTHPATKSRIEYLKKL